MAPKTKAALIGAAILAALGFLRLLFDDPHSGSYVPQTVAGWASYYVAYLAPWAAIGALIGYFVGRRPSAAN